MSNCLCATIDMPISYSLMDAEEMVYIDGGVTIDYNPSLGTKVGAMAYAAAYKIANGWNNISIYDLGAEIFFHAYLYYRGASVVGSLLSNVGGKIGEFGSSIAESIGNGIDVVDGRDTKKEFGIERWAIYDAFYLIAPSKI